MRARLVTSLLALVILVTGALPAVAGVRCISMGVRMQAAPSGCCHHEADARTLRRPCCESYAAPRLEPRQAPRSPETPIQPAMAVAYFAIPPVAPTPSLAELTTTARARGRPPGEKLHLFSTILRV
jgi:hypothetical protein